MATLVATVIAAVYIYYQMRLVMRRQPTSIPALPTTMQEAQVLSLDLRDSTLNRRATVHAIRSAPHDKAHHHFRHFHEFQHCKPRTLARALGEEDYALTRTRSLPGPLSEEQVRWLATYDPLFSAEHPDTVRRAQAHAVDPHRRIPLQRSTSTSGSTSGTRSRASSVAEAKQILIRESTITPSIGPDPTEDLSSDPFTTAEYLPRGAVSLDLARPRSERLGGREIADEADAFAVSRGARRPEYRRYRGESRAALLGRPEWEEKSEAGDSVSELDSKARSIRTGSGMDRGKEKEYGRPRGESGAALLGRPDF